MTQGCPFKPGKWDPLRSKVSEPLAIGLLAIGRQTKVAIGLKADPKWLAIRWLVAYYTLAW